ncbi:cadherin-like domain-containing protein, partial [Escherichia coli]|uniref:cadherin-like domain-containing protein n=1 Tax=Escherichia coli TaxID=562 RepID=UPI0013B4767F
IEAGGEYTHVGGPDTSDELFTFTIVDDEPEHEIGPYQFPVKIIQPIPNAPPTLINNGLEIFKHTSQKISDLQLFATDAKTAPDALIFTVKAKT